MDLGGELLNAFGKRQRVCALGLRAAARRVERLLPHTSGRVVELGGEEPLDLGQRGLREAEAVLGRLLPRAEPERARALGLYLYLPRIRQVEHHGRPRDDIDGAELGRLRYAQTVAVEGERDPFGLVVVVAQREVQLAGRVGAVALDDHSIGCPRVRHGLPAGCRQLLNRWHVLPEPCAIRLDVTCGGAQRAHRGEDGVRQAAPEVPVHSGRLLLSIRVRIVPHAPVAPDLVVRDRAHVTIQPARMPRVPVPLGHGNVHVGRGEDLLVAVGVAVREHLELLGEGPPALVVEVPYRVGHGRFQVLGAEGQGDERRFEVLATIVQAAAIAVVPLDRVRGEPCVEWPAGLVLCVFLKPLPRHFCQMIGNAWVFVDAEVEAPASLVGAIVAFLRSPVTGVANVAELPLRPVHDLLDRLECGGVVSCLLLLDLHHLLEQRQHHLIRRPPGIVVRHHAEVVAPVQVPHKAVALAEVAGVWYGCAVCADAVGFGVEALQVRVVEIALVRRPLDEALGKETVVALHGRAHAPSGVVRVDDE